MLALVTSFIHFVVVFVTIQCICLFVSYWPVFNKVLVFCMLCTVIPYLFPNVCWFNLGLIIFHAIAFLILFGLAHISGLIISMFSSQF